KAVGVLYAVQQRSPDDFLVNYELASLLRQMGPAWREEALGFLRAAVALRPHYPNLHTGLGDMLREAQRLDQAIAAYRQAFDLNPAYLDDLVGALQKKGDWDGVFAVYGKLITLYPKESDPHAKLAYAYRSARRWDKAIAEFQEASRLSPNNTIYHRELAWLL